VPGLLMLDRDVIPTLPPLGSLDVVELVIDRVERGTEVTVLRLLPALGDDWILGAEGALVTC
jgi:hypothetical protein